MLYGAENINHTHYSATAERKEDAPMKKWIALTLAGALLVSMPVLAADGSGSGNAENVQPPQREAVPAPAEAIADDGVPAAVTEAAQEAGMSVGEYVNNAIVEVPGVPDATPVCQGGHVIINGVPSNFTFSLGKPDTVAVSSAQAQAAVLGGRLMNVVNVKAPIKSFNTARVNYYMPGVKAGQKIAVYQLVNGQWTEVGVAEIREDHVVVDMTSLGTLAFVMLP